jgi:DeoR family fructose operon transcriptional repressor
VVPGGYRVRNMLAGEEAAARIRKYNVMKAFISATALHPETGLSVFTSDLIEVKRAMIETAQTVYAAADHSKFGRSALRTFAALTEMDAYITDGRLPAETAEAMRKSGAVLL